ncbi:HNH endonuclease signature motif containing protein [Pseudomonas alliivorans]|nr:HNH endonuclease signature motif containing protein [Pseudomonas alliivorans]MEE5146484.1 HNH endonuclease signature motif containing protein [Pseudomonas alliivorans]
MAIPAVEKKAIERALRKFDTEFRLQPEWAAWDSNGSHKFAILVEGKSYPAKEIVSLATNMAVKDFTRGMPTNGYLRARGFKVIDLRSAPKPEFVKGEIYDRRSEIHDPFGGSFQSGIAPSDKSPAIFLFTGSSGEQYGYVDEMDESGVYSYTGEGQVGHMTLTRGNLAIREHAATGRAIHLFKTLEKRKGQKYIGEFVCADLSWAEGPDKNGETRKIIRFNLVPASHLLEHEEAAPDKLIPDNQSFEFEALRARAYEATIANFNKDKLQTIRTLYSRSKDVKAYVLKRAEGLCESCGTPAPFVTKAGQAYLEPHHVNRLSDGGLDHPKFVAAVCPTCHKEIHYGALGEKKNEALKQVIINKESIADRKLKNLKQSD